MATSKPEQKFLIRGDRLILFLDVCRFADRTCSAIEVEVHGRAAWGARTSCCVHPKEDERHERAVEQLPEKARVAWRSVREHLRFHDAAGGGHFLKPSRQVRYEEEGVDFIGGMECLLYANVEELHGAMINAAPLLQWFVLDASQYDALLPTRDDGRTLYSFFGKIASGELTRSDLFPS